MAKWFPISEAKVDGLPVSLRFCDKKGVYEMEPYILRDDGKWYRIDPPRVLAVQPTHFKIYTTK